MSKANFASDMCSVPNPNSLSSLSSEHVSSLGVAKCEYSFIATQKEAEVCGLYYDTLSTKYFTSTKTKNMEEESKKEKVCCSPVIVTARV